MTKPDKTQVEPEAPAVVTLDHAQDRQLSHVAGTPKGWRRKSPLESAYDKNQLAGGPPRYLAHDRLAAGQRYCEIWDTAQASGRDSTQALMASGGGGSGLPLSQAQAAAIRYLVDLEMRMGDRDRKISRMVCCQGYWPSEAVAEVRGADYKLATMPRLREALDALCEAFEFVAKERGSIVVSRETPAG